VTSVVSVEIGKIPPGFVNQMTVHSLKRQGYQVFKGVMDEFVTARTMVLYTLHDQTLDRARVEDQQQSLDRFLAEVEGPAFRMANISTRNPDAALDIVQDAMIKWVQNYSHKPQDEWPPYSTQYSTPELRTTIERRP
jgi:hypothetical protein